MHVPHTYIYIYTYIHVCHVYVVTVATTVREITTCRREKKIVRMVHVIILHTQCNCILYSMCTYYMWPHIPVLYISLKTSGFFLRCLN